jgi:heme A synthase
MKSFPKTKFKKVAVLNLIYLLFVICFGAYVRMTGSGAGCGSHWPLCNGVIIPRAPVWQTIIEFTHRLTSGGLLFLAFYLVYLAVKYFEKKELIRYLSFVYLGLLFVEALLGAFLVKYEHVAENKSVYRGFSVSIHLVNTFLLILVASGILFFLSRKPLGLRILSLFTKISLALGFLLIVVVGLSGAITALGDTLFPVQSMWEAFLRSGNQAEHLFVRLRVLHPFLAVFSAFYLIAVCFYQKKEEIPLSSFWSSLTIVIFSFQLFLGYLNVYFHAPQGLQLLHLLVALLGLMSYSIFCTAIFLKSE